jgi:hypothetical protein
MRIRNRVRDSLLDYPILVQHLETRDREQVFFRQGDDGREFSTNLEDALVDAVAFYYLGLSDVAQSTGKSTNEWFAHIIRQGLEKGIKTRSQESRDEKRHVLGDFTLDFEEESEPLQEAKARYYQEQKLSANEITLLADAGIIDPNTKITSIDPREYGNPSSDLYR